MNRILCNRAEFVHVSDVARIENGVAVLKTGKSFTSIPAKKATYSFSNDSSDAGTLSKQTVTLDVYTKNASLLLTSHERYILRMSTDKETFLVGSLDYPAIKAISGDKVNSTITFKASHIL
ncbi:MAG: hypothetical protein JW783_08300 [Bacteroidales bacterium]|nr:hypothetical protein [Bacteroidales bacterium]MBN2749942.1 hypothetical protein [Bacteroidales bacterium]